LHLPSALQEANHWRCCNRDGQAREELCHNNTPGQRPGTELSESEESGVLPRRGGVENYS
jgi:hypothetical protein